MTGQVYAASAVTPSKHTPLHDVHVELGASFTDFAGWQMPVRYTSEVAEHTAVRTTAGLFDLSHMGEIEVSGPEAGSALNYALVGRPSKITIGRARYTMLCHTNGGVLDDLVVYRTAETAYLIVANASNVLTVLSELRDRSHGFAATIRDASADWALIAVQGPRSQEIITAVTDADAPALKYYAITPAVLAGVDVQLARTGYTGEDGFEIYCPPTAAAEVWHRLTAVGAEHELVPAGLACRDTLRLEAGMPLYGQELSVQVTPFEAGLGRLVALDKPGGFVGQQALAARRDSGPAEQLVGLVTSGRRSPRTGYPVLDAYTGQRIGRVTSGAPSPTLGHPIAMAYVPVTHAEPGTTLTVDIRGTSTDAEVVELPFYRRQS